MNLIKAAAILHEGEVYQGRRHSEIIADMRSRGIRGAVGKQGFVTIKDEFVTREQAARIALKCGQVKELKFNKHALFSEDLW